MNKEQMFTHERLHSRQVVEQAIKTAVLAHAGQVDKAGAPYILHPLRVMMNVGTDPVAQAVAVLHDLLEDCEGYSPERLVEDGFPPAVVDALVVLTRRTGEVYADFIERIAQNTVATQVKLADLRDNSDLSRFAHPTSKDRARVLERYAPAIARLEEAAAEARSEEETETVPIEYRHRGRQGWMR